MRSIHLAAKPEKAHPESRPVGLVSRCEMTLSISRLSLKPYRKRLLLAVWFYLGALCALLALIVCFVFRSPPLLLPILVLFVGGGAIGTCLALWDKGAS
jgi:hypothetical protein